MKLCRCWRGAFLPVLLFGLSRVPAGAQTTSTSSPTLTALTLERSIPLSGALTTLSLNLPASVLAAIAAGGVEFREQAVYNPQFNTVTFTYFTASPGSTSPTNLLQLNSSSIVGTSVLQVDRTYISTTPVRSVLLVGTLSSGNTPLGSLSGVPAAYSIGYTADTPPKVNNVSEIVAGTAVLYSAAGSGTLTINAPSTGGGGGGTGITVVVTSSSASAGTNAFETGVNQIGLDASKSTSTNAGPLTYSWASSAGFPSATIIGGNTATPTIQLGLKTKYQFTLTVTDASGATSTTTISVNYV